MSTIADKARSTDEVQVIGILSGPRRGYSEELDRETYRLVMDFDEALHFLDPEDGRARDYHASLSRANGAYEIESAPDHHVWVNGERVTGRRLLKSGDLLEIGRGGTVIRYRIYPPGTEARKSVAEIVADCLNGAQADGATQLGKTSHFLVNVTHDLATQSTLWFRFWVIIIITILVTSVVILEIQSLRLQQRVTHEMMRIESIAGMLESRGVEGLSREDLLAMREEVKGQLEYAMQRLTALEAGPGTASRVIADATPAVVFLLGCFGFINPYTGAALRYIEMESGAKLFTVEERGKVVELAFTGTAFVVSETGMLLTNRHIAEPWHDDPRVDIARGRQLRPVLLRIVAYFPEQSSPVAVRLAHVSEEADLALLQPGADRREVVPLELETRPPQPGDEVLLLGYPTGMRALVARTSAEFLKSVTPAGETDSWALARQLADAGYIKPLASRGIVSQVTDDVIVYDAETTIGGSGGPVLDVNGRVIGVNTAILPEFGGSNMGIGARQARRFLEQAMQQSE